MAIIAPRTATITPGILKDADVSLVHYFDFVLVEVTNFFSIQVAILLKLHFCIFLFVLVLVTKELKRIV
jgi:Ca2+/Na+ antiporter